LKKDGKVVGQWALVADPAIKTTPLPKLGAVAF